MSKNSEDDNIVELEEPFADPFVTLRYSVSFGVRTIAYKYVVALIAATLCTFVY